MGLMDAVWTTLVALAVVDVTLVTVAVILWGRIVKWGEVERVKITLAEQEEALGSLFDKLNTVLARWRKREERERQSQPDVRSATSSNRKAALRRRAAELRGLPHPNQLELNGVESYQGSESN